MELRHLRYFLAVAETLNFSRAAVRVRVAQPALSRQIRDLEEEMGVKLFRRSTTHVELTEAGNYFCQQAAKIVSQVELAITGAQQLAKGAVGTFTIGTDWNFLGSFITGAAKILQERHPQLMVQFVELPLHRHAAAVRARQIDIGFVPTMMLGSRADLDLRHVYTARINVVLPRSHRCADQAMVRLRDLKDERWLLMSEASVPGYRAFMIQFMRPAQFTPKFGVSASSPPGLLAHVLTGKGIALMPEIMFKPENPGIVANATDCAPVELSGISLKGSPSPYLGKFLALLDEQTGEFPATAKPKQGKR